MSSVLQFKATLDQILGSINELKRGSVSAQYGTVLGVSPLQVSLDDDPATPLNGVPVSLVSGLAVGDRVWTVSFRSRTIVVGRVGGGVRVCTNFTTATGWDATKLRVVRDGDLVSVAGAFKQSSGNITAPASYAGAFTLPEGFRPTDTTEGPAFGAASNQVGFAGWAWVDTEGRISFGLTGSGPVNRVVFNLTYQAA